MSYSVKRGKLRRTTVSHVQADTLAYTESAAERAATVKGTDELRFSEIECGCLPDGTVVYRVVGLEMDTHETLEAAGLIKLKWRNGLCVETRVYHPSNIRVIAWQLSQNNLARANDEPLPFPDMPERIEIIPATPMGTA